MFLLVQELPDRGKFFWQGNRLLQNVLERMKFALLQDSNRWSGDCLRGQTRSHFRANGATVSCSSLDGYGDGFFKNLLTVGSMGKSAISF